MNLTLERAKEINKNHVTEESLVIHSLNVCYAMGAMAKHFGEDVDHWQGVGYLHDFDYQEFPEEHLQHTEKELLAEICIEGMREHAAEIGLAGNAA